MLGDNASSVVAYNSSPDSGRAISFSITLKNGMAYTVTFDQNGIGLYDGSGKTTWFISGK